jgi:uncharacterized Ntn-hydrolase superfamily protein
MHQQSRERDRISNLASTFSIIAFDPKTRNLGVAVQSRYFSVGTAVPWAQKEVGAVATQSFVNVSYEPKGLKLLKKGLTVHEVIKQLTSKDKGRDYRQLGVIDAKGNAAAFTGEKCLSWAGSKIGKNYAAQGNILASPKVVANMGKYFESTKGDLADRLTAALEGGEKAGGDVRGRQSAALLVVGERKGKTGYGDRLIDLRVEDHPNPIAELKRLLRLHRVYCLIDESEEIYSQGNHKKAIAMIKEAIELNPNSDDAYIDLGMTYRKLENPRSRSSLQESSRSKPEHGESHQTTRNTPRITKLFEGVAFLEI